MKRKEIRILRDFEKSGLTFKSGEKFEVEILHIGMAGGFDRHPEDNTMEGCLYPAAIVEFENGKIMAFEIDFNIHIVGNCE
ncbi:MAG: hypothetical protein LBL07_01000 [Tannerella sp.]|jgi:hypothetical protein|nr:hypothetical protein [Tannerella sp.]